MEPDTNQAKQANFDSNPPVAVNQYDEAMKKFCAAYEPIFAMANAFLTSFLDSEAHTLVVGAGTGTEIVTFGRQHTSWRFTGVDPSADMLEIARNKIEAAGLANSIRLVQGFVHDLPQDELFDASTCILVMHFLPDDGSKLQLLKSIAARLHTGAPLVLVDGYGVKGSQEFEDTVAAWKTFVKQGGVEPQIVEDGFKNQILQRLQFVSEERIISLLADAGFIQPVRFFTGFLYGGWIARKK